MGNAPLFEFNTMNLVFSMFASMLLCDHENSHLYMCDVFSM